MTELKPVEGTDDVYLWKYLPSVPAAALFTLLFAAITSAHCWRTVRTQTWFCIAFAVGGCCQIVGYGVRVYCHYTTDQIPPYVVQSSLIVIAPVFYAASIYMVLGRLIRSVHGEAFSPVRPTRMTKIFVVGDILSLAVQTLGVPMTTQDGKQELGEKVVIAGLLIQLIVFGFFVFAAVMFHVRVRRAVGGKEGVFRPDVPWQQGLTMLYACSVLIVVRSVFRVVEYVTGADGYLLSNEWPLYVFDAALMFATQVIFFVRFPDKFKPGSGRRAGGDDGHVLVGPGVPYAR